MFGNWFDDFMAEAGTALALVLGLVLGMVCVIVDQM